MKIVGIGDFDSSIESFWRTECNAKNISSLQSTIYEKNQENLAKMVKNGQKLPF